MRSPVSKEGIGESKAIKSRQSSHSELTFPSMLEAEFANKRAIVALVVENANLGRELRTRSTRGG
jgi:hypothetical protein